MPSHWIFFSYVRDDWDDYLQQFYQDLVKEIGDKSDLEEGELPGFRDIPDIELGSEWEPKLFRALCNSRLMVAICSRRYIKSPYCGREYHVFLERQNEYRTSMGLTEAPPVIFPLLWTIPAPKRDWPPSVSRFQLNDSRLPGSYYELGLQRLMRDSDLKSDYTKVLLILGEQLAAAGSTHKMDPYTGALSFQNTRSAFEEVLQPVAAAQPKLSAKFAYAAAAPSELISLRAHCESYEPNGGPEWRPFYPVFDKGMGAFAQMVAGNEDLTSQNIELTALLPILNKLEHRRQLAVVFVDPWTARLPEWRKQLRKLDSHILPSYIVVVPWNEADLETKQLDKQLRLELDSLFEFRSAVKHAFFGISFAASPVTLRNKLRKFIASIQMRDLNAATPAREAKNSELQKRAIDSGFASGVKPAIASSREDTGDE